MDRKETNDKLNILIAEDDELNRILLCEILAKYGCRCQASENGNEAMDLFLKERFDVIFLDPYMPVMDGFELERAIREVEDENFEHTPIAICSGSVAREERETELIRKADYHLTKPYSPGEIHHLIDQIRFRGSRNTDPESGANDNAGSGRCELCEPVELPWTGDHLSLEEMCRVFEKMDCDIPFLTSLLEKFKESSAELLTRIRECITENNFEDLISYSQALKGEFHMFHAAVPIRIAEALERVCRTGCVPQNAGDVVAKLEEEVNSVINRYKEFVERISRQE